MAEHDKQATPDRNKGVAPAPRPGAKNRPEPPICRDFDRVSVKAMAVRIRAFCVCAWWRAVWSSLAVGFVYRRGVAWVHRSRPRIGSASVARQGGAWKGAGEVLGLVRDQIAGELPDAHGVGGALS
jgi:hypothetical protein